MPPRSLLHLVPLALPLLLSACETRPDLNLNPGMILSSNQQDYADSWSVREAMDRQEQQGVIAENAVYPYFFDGASADLLPVGERRMALLAEHLKSHPGTLSVLRGDAGNHLYQQRVDTVRKYLHAAGVASSRVAFSSQPPNGEGTSSADILEAYRMNKESNTTSSQNNYNATGTMTYPSSDASVNGGAR